MISATKWVRRGVAAEFPEKIELDEDEMNRISNLAQMQLDDARLDLAEAEAQAGGSTQIDEEAEENDDEEADVAVQAEQKVSETKTADGDDDELAEYNMDDYDDEPVSTAMSAIANVRGLAFHAPDEQDQFLTLPTEQELDEERAELQILPTDNLVLAAKTEDDVSILEVYVYNDAADTDVSALYVHHDFMLPTFPLCLEWLPCKIGETKSSANLVAIGTFEPEIEIWNLDVVDGVFPVAILGQKPEDAKIVPKGTGKKKSKLKKSNDEYHVDAVLSLSSNPHFVNLLASASADTTVKLWDLETTKAVKSFNYHTSKVSSTAWNPLEGTVLLSGGYDHYARVADLRIDDVASGVRSYRVQGDVENVKWHPNGVEFFAGTDGGMIYKFDARKESEPVWTLQAHDSEITTFDINAFANDYMVTGSVDKTIKLWNLAGDRPSMLLSRDLDVGKVFSASFGPEKETAGLLSVGGSSGKLKVWNTFSNKAVRSQIARDYRYTGKDEQIAVANDDEWEEEDSEGDN